MPFPPEAGAKYRQDIVYQSPQWISHYKHGRAIIEGANAFVKDPSNEALEIPDRRRLRGRTAQHLLAALLIATANLRRIDTFN